MIQIKANPASFRDNDGFVFSHEQKIYRLIKTSYFEHYKRFIKSGLYQKLSDRGRILPIHEVDVRNFNTTAYGEVLIVETPSIPIITYPYEWTFSMWRDAAITTLKIALEAIEHDMMLKDATPFNISFFQGRPVHIDTLSFEKLDETKPWVAYKQFCEGFLAPLALMHYNRVFTIGSMFDYPDGISIDFVKKLLPFRAKFNLQLQLHFLAQTISRKATTKNTEVYFAKTQHKKILTSLLNVVQKFTRSNSATKWEDYYQNTITSQDYLNRKSEAILSLLQHEKFEHLLDLGCNDGHFTKLLGRNATWITAIDSDPICVDNFYLTCREAEISNVLTLCVPLHAPTPALGWQNKERAALAERLDADMCLVLALVHHLRISHYISFEMQAEWLSRITRKLLIEFVPKSDAKVQLLLKNREDVFDDYTLEKFKISFENFFEIKNVISIANSERVLFLMQRK